ncbi:ankyrin repeat domain-containing protein [Candidatus Babela massiliensis]|uniref:Ankyrin repeats containing protein n=1 Tax=Candidatus Babela massiliensis TaxID=673862 RepID=V6DHN2_9BACT|nr:ankyrin repeat domain-containing protein [Candidatus Babela massiliensis]CDK31054.1 Ankyrin repeats containing protein [Candidatus Babela massiliensis]
MHKIKSLYLISILYFNNVIAMDQSIAIQEIEQDAYILSMPNELIVTILANVVKEYMKDWQDIFNFDKENFKKAIENIRLTCQAFNNCFSDEYLIEIIKILKQERFKYLFNSTKAQFKSDDSNLSLEELDTKLINILKQCKISEEDKKEVIRLLLLGANIDVQDKDGNTALIIAAKKPNSDIIRILIASGANVNAQNKDANTALMEAIHEYWNPFYYDYYKDIVKLLIANGADVNLKNNKGQTALMWASYKGLIEIFNALIVAGADIYVQDNDKITPLIWAASGQGKKRPIFELFISRGLNVNAKTNNGNTTLMFASRNDDLDSVKFLIESGAEVNAKNNEGRTALMFASAHTFDKYKKNMVKFLIESGAEVNTKDNKGRNALMLASGACYEGYEIDTVKFLIKLGEEFHIKDNKGKSALMLACRRKNQKIVEYLVAKGVDVNVQDNKGRTALMFASYCIHSFIPNYTYWEQKNITSFLIKSGAVVNTKDNEGKNAFIYAKERGHSCLARILLDSGSEGVLPDDNKNQILLKSGISVALVGATFFIINKTKNKNFKQETDKVKNKNLILKNKIFDNVK